MVHLSFEAARPCGRTGSLSTAWPHQQGLAGHLSRGRNRQAGDAGKDGKDGKDGDAGKDGKMMVEELSGRPEGLRAVLVARPSARKRATWSPSSNSVSSSSRLSTYR
ncbi:hypothetical protein [Arthrobacter sp. B1I2]|uniref:hypothetical protein n=1 Tax=Arthrobacter sp. B1I2 TaxID=3042263 RepID=UPI002786CADB|nr:hypothetical protein [Arthrobacter sp. B1I2]MDQ0730510.1 hypothetical protein [Arthrobacter sp. B1I2]